MFLLTSAHQLVLLAEGENVVSEDVVAAVVLVKRRALAAVDNVVFHYDSGAALVGVKTPAAVTVRVDVMDEIVSDNRTLLNAQRIDGAHIAENALPNVVEMVELDNVFAA